MAKTPYPIGARWRYAAPNGDVGEVWLEKRDEERGQEVWYYRFEHKDGSGSVVDWAPTRQKAVELCSILFFYHKKEFQKTRFKRVKGETS